MNELNKKIKQLSQSLLCETHPNVCALRDENLDQLVAKVKNMIISNTETMSIQTAFAELETALAEAKN